MSIHKFNADLNYDGINANTTDEEKLNIIFKVLGTNTSPDYIRYDKLLIKNEDQNYFDALVKRSGLVEIIDSQNSYHPGFKLNDSGRLVLRQHGSYLNYLSYLNDKNAKEQADNDEKEEMDTKIKQLTLEALEKDKRVRMLQDDLLASNYKFSELQIKELKYRKLYAIIGAIGGAILTFIITIILRKAGF